MGPRIAEVSGMKKNHARTSIIDDMIEAVAVINEATLTGAPLAAAGALVDRIKDHVYSLGVNANDPRLEAW